MTGHEFLVANQPWRPQGKSGLSVHPQHSTVFDEDDCKKCIHNKYSVQKFFHNKRQGAFIKMFRSKFHSMWD